PPLTPPVTRSPDTTLFRSGTTLRCFSDDLQKLDIVIVRRDIFYIEFCPGKKSVLQFKKVVIFRAELFVNIPDSQCDGALTGRRIDRKSTRLNSSHVSISYA